MKKQLIEISNQYKQKNALDERTLKDRINQLYKDYILQREKGLIDAMTTAVAIDSIFSSDQIDYSKINPQMEEAFHLAYPNHEIGSLSSYNTEQLQGFINSWKGKYFEVTVRDQLNQGDWVGDLHLENGHQAILAGDPTQIGWDLQIIDADGIIVQELQLKATESLSYVKEALEKYPNIEILTTEEISDELSKKVLTSDISENSLEELIISPMEDLLDSSLENLLESVLPGLPFILIAVGEGRHIITGRKSLELAAQNIRERSVKTGIAMGVGALAFILTGTGFVAIPVSFLTRIGIDRYKNSVDLNNIIKKENSTIQKMLPYYTNSNFV